MEDKLHSKLDEAVKRSMENYSAPEPSDWAAMEQKLAKAPGSSMFPWKYVLNGTIALAVLAGLGAGINAIVRNSEKPAEQPAASVQTTPPVNVAPPSAPPVTPSLPVVTQESPSPEPPAVADTKETRKEPEAVSEKKTKVRKDKTAVTEMPDVSVLGMGNEPVFGDMLDSSKGIVGETREDAEKKEAAKKSREVPVGWNTFMLKNVNPDSIKNYRERLKKDSIP